MEKHLIRFTIADCVSDTNIALSDDGTANCEVIEIYASIFKLLLYFSSNLLFDGQVRAHPFIYVSFAVCHAIISITCLYLYNEVILWLFLIIIAIVCSLLKVLNAELFAIKFKESLRIVTSHCMMLNCELLLAGG